MIRIHRVSLTQHENEVISSKFHLPWRVSHHVLNFLNLLFFRLIFSRKVLLIPLSFLSERIQVYRITSVKTNRYHQKPCGQIVEQLTVLFIYKHCWHTKMVQVARFDVSEVAIDRVFLFSFALVSIGGSDNQGLQNCNEGIVEQGLANQRVHKR